MSMYNQNTTDVDIDFVFMSTQTNLGTINAAVDWADATAESANVLGVIITDGTDVATNLVTGRLSTWSLISGSPSFSQLPMLLQADEGSTSVYVSGVLRDGTPTFAADDIDLIFHIEYL